MIANAEREKILAMQLRQHGRRIAAVKDLIEAEARPIAQTTDDITPKEHAFYALRDKLDDALYLVDRVVDFLSSDEDETENVDD